MPRKTSDHTEYNWASHNISKIKNRPDWVSEDGWAFIRHVAARIKAQEFKAPGANGGSLVFSPNASGTWTFIGRRSPSDHIQTEDARFYEGAEDAA